LKGQISELNEALVESKKEASFLRDEEVKKIKAQLKELATEKEKQAAWVKKLQTPQEIACSNFITDKLLPMTEEYSAHLVREATKLNPSFNPEYYEDFSAAIREDQEIYARVIKKYAVVQNLREYLTDKETNPLPSERITQFTRSLKIAHAPLKEHRDEPWVRYFKTTITAIGIVCTGIIPGILLLLAYSEATKKSFFFFNKSEGEEFTRRARTCSLSFEEKNKEDQEHRQFNEIR
jgi:hypothetical protein